jgi:transposase
VAKNLTPDLADELRDAISPHLPPRPAHNPKGGHPWADDKAALRGILYLLREGCRWQKIPSAALACPSGSTCWRRFRDWTAAGVRDKARLRLLDLLGEEGVLDLERIVADSASPRARKGGAHTGRNPADRGYGFPHLIEIVLLHGIVSKLSPRGKDKPHGSGLGEKRCVVERTMSRWTRFRRINLCHERKGEHFQGMHLLAACVICSSKLRAARAAKQPPDQGA